MTKASVKKSKTIPEAETRLQNSLERLRTIIKARRASGAEVDKLRSDNTELEARFQGLKSEYDLLEKSFKDLKTSVASMSAKREADKDSPELGKGKDWKDAGLAPDPETEFLKKELERVHKEYKTLDQSFRILRGQYNELQKTYEDALEGSQVDLVSQAEATEEAKPAASETGMGEIKKDLGAQLDKTIAALEKLVG